MSAVFAHNTMFSFFQDPSLKPREVHRGLDGLPDIPDGEFAYLTHKIDNPPVTSEVLIKDNLIKY